MGRLVLICRLAVRDLRRRRAEAVLLLLAFTAATATLTLGLALNGVTSQPYDQTRAQTAGPDVVAQANDTGPVSPAELAALNAVAKQPGVVATSGPFPTTWVVLGAKGNTAGAQAQGRDVAVASVDQPKLTQGSWLTGSDQVVIERSFADALGVGAGDTVTLNGRSFHVAGVAVSAAVAPYPQACNAGCEWNSTQQAHDNSGLIWLTQADARSLATAAQPLYYRLNLKLSNPDNADAFVNNYEENQTSPTAPSLTSWTFLSHQDARLATSVEADMLVGSWLLSMLALASVAVLVGGRMADQTRRVGLLKAVGGTPGLISAILLAEYVVLALVASALGLLLGRLAAPLLTDPGAGLLGTASTPPVTPATVGLVAGVAVLVAVVATGIPALRAARTSTVNALTNAARPPRRRALLIELSARLPVPLLLGMRLAARRPRRTMLSTTSIFVTASGLVAVLMAHARISAQQLGGLSNLDNPQTDRINQVLAAITVMMGTLAAINAIFITWATVLDSRRASAVSRAFGASPQQITAGLVAAQVLPTLVGSVLGIPGGILLYLAVRHGGATSFPSPVLLLAVVVGALIAVALLTAVPARLGVRRPVAEILQAETG